MSRGERIVKIRMYNCGFGDCFRLTSLNGEKLFVDFGIHSMSCDLIPRDIRYDNIMVDIDKGSDFLLTHYHEDHYSGAVYMGQLGKKFRNVYIPDVWSVDGSIEVVSLILLRGLLTKSVIKRGLTLFDFLQSICGSRVFFISRGSIIQNMYEVLWPTDEWIKKKTKKIFRNWPIGTEDYLNDLIRISRELRTIVLNLAMSDYTEQNISLAYEIEKLKAQYIQLSSKMPMAGGMQYKLTNLGNSISIVFQNRNEQDVNVLFTGDVKGKEVWKHIESNIHDSIMMKGQYDIIKVPHHGTSPYYHSFSSRMNDHTTLLIPHGKTRAPWYVDGRYYVDSNDKGSKVICTSDEACDLCRAGHIDI